MLTHLKKLTDVPGWLWRRYVKYWRTSRWHKAVVAVICLILLGLAGMYGIARWYMWQESSKPLTLGTSFIADYAESFGLNPETTLSAILNDLHVKHIRFVSYWNDIEPTPGHYDFSSLDWQFKIAETAHAKVTLSIGLRQPRWPECHAPTWVDTTKPVGQWQPQLEQFMTAVINHYKNNPALESYQLENEYFLKVFGKCNNFDRQRLVDEYNLVKKLDPNHTLIIARSNNALGTPLGQPTPDEYGVSVYKRVWDSTITHRYVEYPFPAWFYSFLAGTEKIIKGKDTIIHELQAEPWPPHGEPITSISLAEQNKSLSPEILKNRIEYGETTGIKTIDLWGSEYWYYRKVVLHDPSLWNIAKQAYLDANQNKDAQLVTDN